MPDTETFVCPGSVRAIADWVLAHGGSCTSPLAYMAGSENSFRVETVDGSVEVRTGDRLTSESYGAIRWERPL